MNTTILRLEASHFALNGEEVFDDKQDLPRPVRPRLARGDDITEVLLERSNTVVLEHHGTNFGERLPTQIQAW
jgi:hypothetical protein